MVLMLRASTYTILDSGQVSSYFITSNSSGTQTIATGSLALSAGDLTLGSSGNPSALTLYPAGTGAFILTATTNVSGAYYTNLTTDSAVGQNQIITIPDGGTALSNVLLTNSGGTQTIATGNLILAEGYLVLGSNGFGSQLTLFSSGTDTGAIILTATNNSGHYNTLITNAAMGQTTYLTIPNPSVENANFLLSDNSGTQTINTGNLFISTGVLTLGSNQHASSLTIYPAGNNLGHLIIQPTNASGAYITTVTNAAMGQVTELVLSDPHNAVGQVMVQAGTTPIVSGNVVTAGATLGVLQDAGFAIVYGTSSSLGVADVVVFSASNVVGTSSIVTVTITLLTTPTATLISTVAAAGTITMTFDLPPGAISIAYICINPN